MSLIISGTDGVTFNDSSLQGAAASPYVLKNRIINGAMVIDQRNSGASISVQGGEYSVDRWATNASQTSKFSAQQNAGSVTPPTGYVNYLGLTSSAATTVGASDVFNVAQYIEGLNCADLGWGTASASTITLSFWVRSSLTGTFGGALTNSGVTRSYPFSYTISAANTWEQKSVTITGDTTGTWLTTNGIGIRLYFSLGTGSTRAATAGAWAAGDYRTATGATNVVSTNGATFYITGVQLEIGSTATPFERRIYSNELALCQRYCYVPNVTGATTPIAMGNARDTTYAYVLANMPVTMRTSPSISYNSISNFYISGSSGFMGGTDTVLTALSTLSSATTNNNSVVLIATVGSAVLTQFRPTGLTYANTNGILTFSAEL